MLSPLDRQRLKERLAADLRAGNTVALPAGSDADLREAFPAVLAEVQAELGPSPLPGYELLEEIGRGGMSTVWLARQTSLQRKVALKFLPPGLEQSPKARKRMVHEAQVLGRLQHPHIVDVHDVIVDGDRVVLAMEWVDGRSLLQIARGLPRPPAAPAIAQVAALLGADPAPLLARGADWTAFAVGVVRDVALAANAAHTQGLLHLDIKPANILLRRDGVAKLADFGVARDLDVLLTHTASFAGTPIYAAPEQLGRDDARIGPATDVYGLGITLYELLAREQPFSATGITAALRRIERGGAPPLSRRVDVPADLESVVHRAIDPAPAKRYASAADLAADLEAVLEHRPVTARPLTRTRRFLRWARHEPWQAALLALVPGLLVLGTVLLAEFPRIARAHAAEAHTASMAHLQLGCQLFFIVGSPDEDVRTELEQALAAERDSPMALAALAIALADHDGPAAARVLDDHPRVLAEHRGLRLLRAQAAADRCCLDEAEFAALQRSSDVIDLFTAALGRLLLAQEHHDRHTYDLALAQLDRVDAGMGVANPLVKGLLAVCAAEACDARRLELAEFALHENWPDAPPAVLWDVVALQSFAPDRAVATCRDYLGRHGDDLRVHQSLLAILSEQGHFDEALAHVDEMTAAGFPADVTRRPRLLVWAAMGRKDDVLRDLGTEDFTDTAAHLAFRGRLLEKFAPDSAIDCYRRGLALADPVLRAELNFRLANVLSYPPYKQTAEGLDLYSAAVEARPEHVEYRWRLAIALTGCARAEDARSHFDRLRAQDLHLDPACWPMTRCYMTVHDYGAMLECAQDWWHSHQNDASPPVYVGIAQSRLGKPRDAMDSIRQSFVKGKEKGLHPSGRALIERSWLQVEPDGDPDLRDPQRALDTLEQLGNNTDNPQGPWFLYALAEARAANGMFAEAIESAARAQKRLVAAEPEAPPDLAQRIEAALQRFQGAQKKK